MTPEQKANNWLDSKNLDDASRNEIIKLRENDNREFVEAFHKDLEFGTGGLRGIMGVGTNRINQYTVGMATQGLFNYLAKAFPDEIIKVAIAFDSRNKSREFAQTTANVFSANGSEVFLFEDLRPTPELSFAVRQLKCHSGVVITASHNPKEYNGYKAYWSDGGQLTSPHDQNVISEVEAIGSIDNVKFEGNSELIQIVGQDLDDQYLKMVKSLSLEDSGVKDLKIVYSSIHGTGVTMVPQALKSLGFSNVQQVEEQKIPDGNFPTVIYPNPEEAEAMSIAVKKARDTDADLIMATDPDADRVGIATKDLNGEFQLLNGNQTGALLVHYMLDRWGTKGKLTSNVFIAKTIVTSELIKSIADAFKVNCYDTLTGFKFIAELIRNLEGQEQFIVGGEESYGYMIGDNVRDKDAVSSCAMIAEMAQWAMNKGLSLFDLLIEIYIQHGLYVEKLKSITKKGISGSHEINEMMIGFRSTPPDKLDNSKVTALIDYKNGTQHDLTSGVVSTLSFPKSNVLQFLTEDGSKISVRPSGTEPKIKFYFSVHSVLADKSDYFATVSQLEQKINRITQALEN